jgi:hypothetical protein
MLGTLYEIPKFTYVVNNWATKKKKMQHVLEQKSKLEVLKSVFGSRILETDRVANVRSAYVQDFATIFSEELQQFSQELKKDFIVQNVWTVNYCKGDYQNPHSHGTCNLTGIIYFNYDPLVHTPTVFMPTTIDSIGNYTPIVWEGTKEGLMVIVPANILHYVEPNQTKKNRTVIAFDITLDKLVHL